MVEKIFKKIVLVGMIVFWGFGQNGFAEPVETGIGKVKLKGLLHFWHINDQSVSPKDTFRLRRSEIRLSGEIKPEVNWSIMIDPAQVREDTIRKSPLQDFIVTLKSHNRYSIKFGQFKVPFGMEGLSSSAKLDFIERAAISSIFKWSDKRDIGVQIKKDFKLGDVEIQPVIGIFNGEGQNRPDANNFKDISLRVVVKPIKDLQIGIAHYNGKKGIAEDNNIHTGGEVKFEQNKISLKAEYAVGKSGGKDKQTYYGSAGYKFIEKYQAVLRYDFWDPDTNTSDDAQSETTLGLNYFILKNNAKIQLGYGFRDEEGPAADNDIFRINVQISY